MRKFPVAKVIVLAVLLLGVFMAFAFWMLLNRLLPVQSKRSSDYRINLEHALGNKLFAQARHFAPVVSRLGDPVKQECCVKVVPGAHWSVEVPVSGPLGRGKLLATIHRDDGIVFDSFALTTTDGANVDLMPDHKPIPPDELHGEGRIYLVPVGHQAVPMDRFAKHYKEKFGLTVELLPPLEMPKAAWDEQRHQYAAEDMVQAIWAAHPELANSGNNFLYAITHDDIHMRRNDWDFTYALRVGERSAVVSTARMYERYWKPAIGNQPGRTLSPAEVSEAETKAEQMLTKEFAVQYWRLPMNHDPMSILLEIFTPDGRPDDIVRSDLRPERTIFGLNYGCLSMSYHYDTGHLSPPGGPRECNPSMPGIEEERFMIDLGRKRLFVATGDFALAAPIPIHFRHSYGSKAYGLELGMGPSVRHNFNPDITSNGLQNLEYMDIEDADYQTRFERTTPGRGFEPNFKFVSKRENNDYFGATMSWQNGRFKVVLKNGEIRWFVPCVTTNIRCYLDGVERPDGSAIKIERDAKQNLLRISSGPAAIQFEHDADNLLTSAVASDGTSRKFTYNSQRCLATVERPGATSVYQYDERCHLIAMDVKQNGKTVPVLRARYAGDLLQELTFGNQRILMDVPPAPGAEMAVRLPDGEVIDYFTESGNGWIAYARPNP